MDYTVKLHTGDSFVMEGADIDSGLLAQQLNNERVLFVNLSGVIVDKKVIAAMIPRQAPGGDQEGGGDGGK